MMMTIAITIILLMKYLSLAGGDEAGEEQFTSSISPTLVIVMVMIIISPTMVLVIMIMTMVIIRTMIIKIFLFKPTLIIDDRWCHQYKTCISSRGNQRQVGTGSVDLLVAVGGENVKCEKGANYAKC